jgi:sporulation protein YlmC with PRC-barrel domain
MKTTGEIDLGLGVLDHQLVDSEGRRCGKVDDLELEGLSHGTPKVVAIVAGVGAWRGRGIVARFAAGLVRARIARVPWAEVEAVASAVQLKRSARELRLGRGDDRARLLIERIPKSR